MLVVSTSRHPTIDYRFSLKPSINRPPVMLDRPRRVLFLRLLSFSVVVSVYLSLSVCLCFSVSVGRRNSYSNFSSSISTASLSFNQFVTSPITNLLVHVNMTATTFGQWEISAWDQFRFDAHCQFSHSSSSTHSLHFHVVILNRVP